MKTDLAVAAGICLLLLSASSSPAETQDQVDILIGFSRAHSQSLVNGVAHGVYEGYHLERGVGEKTPDDQYTKMTIEFDYAFDAVQRCFRVDSRYLAHANVAADGGAPSETILGEPFPGAYQNNQRLSFYHDSTKTSIRAAWWSDRVCQVEMGIAWEEPHSGVPEPDFMLSDPSFSADYLDDIHASDLRATQRDNYYRRLLLESEDGELPAIVIRQDKLALTDLSVRRGDPPSANGTYVYDLVSQRFWIHPEHGYVQRYQVLQSVYPQKEFGDAFVLEGKAFRMIRAIPEPNLGVDVRITYAPIARPFFPREILRRDFIDLPSSPSPVVLNQWRIRFDSVDLNREGFSAADFFLYPEFQAHIFVAGDGSKGTPILPEQYLSFFSDLSLDPSRVVIRNPWLFSGGIQ